MTGRQAVYHRTGSLSLLGALERGTPAQWAEELEHAARPSLVPAVRTSESPAPAPSAEARGATVPLAEKSPGDSAHLRSPARRRWPWLATAASGLALAAWVGWGLVGKLAETPSALSATATGAQRADAGTAGLGEAVSAAPTMDAPGPSLPVMAEEPLPEPMPGQTRPDAKGRCPRKRQVALNGACWVPFDSDPEACEASVGQLFRGKCYVPDLPRNRSTTSQPPQKP